MTDLIDCLFQEQCIPRVWTVHKTPNAMGDQVVGL